MDKYRAPSLFQPHRARQAVRDAHDGKIAPMVGLYLSMSTVPTAMFMSSMGFDWVWIDWEHSSCNVETMTMMVHSTMMGSEGKTMPFVRVPGHDHAAIGFALDAGASIIVPQIETVDQARHVVSAAKFGTKHNGTRSAPPFRLIPGITDECIDSSKTIHENLNDQAAIMIQIETLQGIKNLDAILTEVKDIDVVWLGTLDARVSMSLTGNGGLGGPEPEWQEALKLFEDTVAKHNVAYAGFAFYSFSSSDEAFAAGGKGKCMLTVFADALALVQCQEDINRARNTFKAISVDGEAV